MTKRKTEQRTATLAGREVGYTITFSPKAVKARIRVGPGGVEVVVPKSGTADRAVELLAEQATWVNRQLDRVKAMGSVRMPVAEPPAGTILLGGERVQVRTVTVETNRRFAVVSRTPDGLIVSVPKNADINTGRAIENWLRRYARTVVEARVGIWSVALKRTPNRVYLRSQRTKWGNCSKLRNLSFNWRLVMAPQATLDAIVIHELAHLIEPTHETRFWLLVRSHCPNYDVHVRWLTENYAALFTAPAPRSGE